MNWLKRLFGFNVDQKPEQTPHPLDGSVRVQEERAAVVQPPAPVVEQPVVEEKPKKQRKPRAKKAPWPFESDIIIAASPPPAKIKKSKKVV